MTTPFMTAPWLQAEHYGSALAALSLIAVMAMMLCRPLALAAVRSLVGHCSRGNRLRLAITFFSLFACLPLALMSINANAASLQCTSGAESAKPKIAAEPLDTLTTIYNNFSALMDQIKKSHTPDSGVPPSCQTSPLCCAIIPLIESETSDDQRDGLIASIVRKLVRLNDFQCALSIIEKIKESKHRKSLRGSVTRAQIRTSLSGRIPYPNHDSVCSPECTTKCKPCSIVGK